MIDFNYLVASFFLIIVSAVSATIGVCLSVLIIDRVFSRFIR